MPPTAERPQRQWDTLKEPWAVPGVRSAWWVAGTWQEKEVSQNRCRCRSRPCREREGDTRFSRAGVADAEEGAGREPVGEGGAGLVPQRRRGKAGLWGLRSQD